MRELILYQMLVAVLLVIANFGAMIFGNVNRFCEFIKYGSAFGAFAWTGYFLVLLARLLKII